VSAIIPHNALGMAHLHSATQTRGVFTRNLSAPVVEPIEIVIFLGFASAHDATFILNQNNKPVSLEGALEA